MRVLFLLHKPSTFFLLMFQIYDYIEIKEEKISSFIIPSNTCTHYLIKNYN